MKHKQRVHRGPAQLFEEQIAGLTGLPLEQARLLIQMGGAYLGKYRCKEGQRQVREGDLIAAYWQLPLVMETVVFDPTWIVDETKGFLIATKPAGMPTQGRRDADYMAFYEILGQHIKGYLGLHHRLDQDTSGLMVFTRKRELNKDLARAFAERQVTKEYIALCQGQWKHSEDQLTIDAAIASRTGSRGTVHQVSASGKQASTQITRLAEAEGLVLVLAKPLTGRTHQIRVHLSHLGLPLRGDDWYGAPPHQGHGPRFLLHCRRLAWPRLGTLPAADYFLPAPESWRFHLPEAMYDLAWEGSC